MSTSTRDRISRSVARSRREVFLRGDFQDFGTPSRVTRALSDLVAEGRLIRLGYGVYAKGVLSPLSGKPIPRRTLEELLQEAFMRLDVEASFGASDANYVSGRTTQVPMALSVRTRGRRVKRQLALGGRTVKYETNRA